MRILLLTCALVAGLAVAKSKAEAQFGFPPPTNYFRSGVISPSINDAPASVIANEQLQQGRLFFTTLTLTYTTSTSTITSTVSTVCTTSTAALKVCTPSGRRRRSIAGGRGLFYSEHDAHAEEGSIFLPSPAKTEDETAVAPVDESSRAARSTPSETSIPYVVQPGFNVPDGVPSGRFLLAFGTTTTTVTSTTTYISSLTAICLSTTAYQLCGSTGK